MSHIPVEMNESCHDDVRNNRNDIKSHIMSHIPIQICDVIVFVCAT